MRAAVCRAFGEPLVVEELELAAPQAGEVRVRVAACAICHSDVASVTGDWGGTVPAVYGHEAAGVVDEAGESVRSVAPGDHVVITLVRACGECYLCARGQPALCEATFALDEQSPLERPDGTSVTQGLRTGAFAEQVIVHASQAIPIPRELPLEAASLLGCGVLTGYGAVAHTAGVEAGDSVIVVGAGGVGLNCVQGAVLRGASPIVAVDPLRAKRDVADALGATDTCSPDKALDTVRRLTAARGADHVVVAAGAREAIELALMLVRRGGTVTLVGMPATGVTVELDPTAIAHDGIRIAGSKMGSTRPQVDVPVLASLALAGRLQLERLVTGRYPLEEINEAFASFVRGEALRHVVVP